MNYRLKTRLRRASSKEQLSEEATWRAKSGGLSGGEWKTMAFPVTKLQPCTSLRASTRDCNTLTP
jgi:hypothetical protein